MEVTHIKNIKYSTLILLLCYAVSATATCSRRVTVDGKIITKFDPLPVQTITTNMSLSYDAKGLQPLFNLAISFMNTVQPKNFGDVFKNDEIGKLFGNPGWKRLIKEYEIPILVTIGVGLLFFLLMPIVGCCFCMCRCCDRCGGDMKQSEKKSQQHCKVAFMVFFLFAFTVLMLCGVLFMFVTNDRLHGAAGNVIQTYDHAIDEAETMVDVVLKDVITLTTQQVSCVTNLVRTNMNDDEITKVIGNPLLDYIKANVSAVLVVATEISQGIDAIYTTLQDVQSKENTFNDRVAELNSTINTARSSLQDTITECKGTPALSVTCDKLITIKGGINVNMDFGSRPDIGVYLDELRKIKEKGLNETIKMANDTVNNIPKTVIEKSNSSLADIKTQLTTAEKKVRDAGVDLKANLKKEVTKIKDKLKDFTFYKNFDEGGKRYEAIRWKIYVALSAVMAFIVFLLFCGLACGSCGYNKEYMPTERSATANCGGNFLMAAVGIMFIFSFIFMIFCVLWFAVGMHVHVACRELKDGALFDNLIVKHIGGGMQNVSLVEILKNCRNNSGIYQASSLLEDKFNITKKFDMSVLDDINEKIENNIKFDLKTTKILTPDTEAALNETIASDVYKMNFTKFHEVLNSSIMAANITEIVANLTKLADELNASGVAAGVALAVKIRSMAVNLTNAEKNVIQGMMDDIDGLRGTVNKLEEETAPMQERATVLLANMRASEDFIQNETPNMIKNLILGFAKVLVSYVRDGVDHIIGEVKTNLGRCKPVANIYDGVVNTFLCDDIVQNSNGFWLALGWCLLFFIPSIILSVKLAKYFRKMDYSTGMDTIVVDHPPYNDKLPAHNPPYTTPGYSHDLRAPPPYTSTQHNNPGYQHA